MRSPYASAVRSPEVSCLINSDQNSSFEIISVLTTFFCSWPPSLLFSSFLFRLEACATEPLHMRRSLLTRSLVQTELLTQMWMISSWSGDSTATELTSRMWTRDTDRNTSLEDSLFLNLHVLSWHKKHCKGRSMREKHWGCLQDPSLEHYHNCTWELQTPGG